MGKGFNKKYKFLSNFESDYDIQNYDEAENINESRDSHKKKFVRFDSSRFPDLLDALRQGNKNYITYWGDSLYNVDYTPKHLSVMTKKLAKNCRYFEWKDEVLGSRIANFMDMPTVFNARMIDDNLDDYLLTVDFIQPGQQITTLGEDENYLGINNLSSLLNVADKLKNRKYKGIEMSDEDLKKAKRDLVRIYMFRRIVIGDSDFNLDNIPVILDENKGILIGPNMDIERGFHVPVLSFELDSCRYCSKNYPDIWENICEKYSELMEHENLSGLLKESQINVLYRPSYYSFMKENYNNFIGFCDIINKEKDMTM